MKLKLPGLFYNFAIGISIYAFYKLVHLHIYAEAILSLIAGFFILSGACESLLLSSENLGKKLHWTEFLAGTFGEIISTLPEFVVIFFVVMVDPLTAFIIPLVTIYNNALILSIYAYFLPKNEWGVFKLPPAVTYAGAELLACGGGLSITLGLTMLLLRTVKVPAVTHFSGTDLIFIAILMFIIFFWYLRTLVKYYSRSKEYKDTDIIVLDENEKSSSFTHIFIFFFIGMIAAILGGESVSHFAHIALKDIKLPILVTSIILAIFAGMSEYVIVYKAHKRGDLGIALSNVFGGITQVMFLVFPFALLCIGLLQKYGLLLIGKELTVLGLPFMGIPIDFTSILLIALLFPVCYVLLETILDDRKFSNFDATVLTCIYTIVLYILINYS